jgi:hypothetical protein
MMCRVRPSQLVTGSGRSPGLVVEEDARVADEQFGVLEMRGVAGVGVQDELGVGEELLSWVNLVMMPASRRTGMTVSVT